MEITAEHVDFIQEDIVKRGIVLPGLRDNLVDHICCALEEVEGNFENEYHRIIASFGEEGLARVQLETVLVLTIKKEENMKKTMYVLGYLALAFSSTGLLFKLQHWPGASILLLVGIAILNFGFLPMFFYDRYKTAIQ